MSRGSEEGRDARSARALVALPWSGMEGVRAAFVPAAAELVDVCEADRLCNGPLWIEEHARAFAAPDSLFGWVVREGEAVVAALAFRVEPSRGALALKRALLAPDGTFDSDYLEPLVRPGYEGAVAARMIDELAASRRVHALVLSVVPSGSRFLEAFRAETERRGLPRRERPCDCLAAPLADGPGVPGAFEAYVASLKSRMRSKVRQAMRRADEAGARLAWCDERDALAVHLEGLFDLHTQRWNEAGEPGSFADERRRAFYHALAPALLDRGALAFSRLELDGRVLAYQFGARIGATYYQLQEGYAPDEAGFRPATALRARSIEALIASGVTSYDFMAGATRHKLDWGGVERPCTTLACALPNLRARLAYGARAWLDRRRER